MHTSTCTRYMENFDCEIWNVASESIGEVGREHFSYCENIRRASRVHFSSFTYFFFFFFILNENREKMEGRIVWTRKERDRERKSSKSARPEISPFVPMKQWKKKKRIKKKKFIRQRALYTIAHTAGKGEKRYCWKRENTSVDAKWKTNKESSTVCRSGHKVMTKVRTTSCLRWIGNEKNIQASERLV